MANTYTQIHIQAVFAVQNRECIISPDWQDELYKYISGIIQKNKHKVLAINGMPDHIHVLIGLRPTQSVSELLQDIKSGSSKWINEKSFLKCKFSWQEGYGAFSYSKLDLSKVINYINNQKIHHGKRTFINEYLQLLQIHEIEFDEQYVFKPVDINYVVPNATDSMSLRDSKTC